MPRRAYGRLNEDDEGPGAVAPPSAVAPDDDVRDINIVSNPLVMQDVVVAEAAPAAAAPGTNAATTRATSSSPPDSTAAAAAAAAAEPSAPGFRVFILTPSNERYAVSVPSGRESTIRELKGLVAGPSSVEPERQRLIFRGRILDDDGATLGAAHVTDGAVMHLAAQPSGGIPLAAEAPRGAAEVGIPMAGVASDQTGVDVVAARRRETAAAAAERLGLPNPELYSVHVLQWRNSIRLISSILLFFFVIGLLGEFAVWFHPERAQKVDSAGAYGIYVGSVLTNIAGIYYSFVGVKAAVHLSLSLAKMFHRGLMAIVLAEFTISIAMSVVPNGMSVPGAIGELDERAMGGSQSTSPPTPSPGTQTDAAATTSTGVGAGARSAEDLRAKQGMMIMMNNMIRLAFWLFVLYSSKRFVKALEHHRAQQRVAQTIRGGEVLTGAIRVVPRRPSARRLGTPGDVVASRV